MPDATISPDLDEFELHDLAQLAPSNPRIPGDEWDLTRDAILGSVTARSARRTSTLPRVAAAAAAVAVVGGLGYGILRPDTHSVTPAAPAPSSSTPVTPASQPSDHAPYRRIPTGHYLTRTFTMTQVSGAEKSFEKRTEWWSWDNKCGATGTTEHGPTSIPESACLPGYQLKGMPRESQAMRSWAVKSFKVAGDRRADDRVAWEFATDLFRDMRTTAAFRQDLVTMLGKNPNTTISNGTVMGRRAVTVTFHFPAHDGTPIVQTASLDASSMALLQETTKGKVGASTTSVDYRLAMDSLERMVDHKP